MMLNALDSLLMDHARTASAAAILTGQEVDATTLLMDATITIFAYRRDLHLNQDSAVTRALVAASMTGPVTARIAMVNLHPQQELALARVGGAATIPSGPVSTFALACLLAPTILIVVYKCFMIVAVKTAAILAIYLWCEQQSLSVGWLREGKGRKEERKEGIFNHHLYFIKLVEWLGSLPI
jgi:hypothetical protein